MEKQIKQEKLLSILRRYNSKIDEICQDWWRSQDKVKKFDKVNNCDIL